jgi:hypothetical protein
LYSLEAAITIEAAPTDKPKSKTASSVPMPEPGSVLKNSSEDESKEVNKLIIRCELGERRNGARAPILGTYLISKRLDLSRG